MSTLSAVGLPTHKPPQSQARPAEKRRGVREEGEEELRGGGGEWGRIGKKKNKLQFVMELFYHCSTTVNYSMAK